MKLALLQLGEEQPCLVPHPGGLQRHMSALQDPAAAAVQMTEERQRAECFFGAPVGILENKN